MRFLVNLAVIIAGFYFGGLWIGLVVFIGLLIFNPQD